MNKINTYKKKKKIDFTFIYYFVVIYSRINKPFPHSISFPIMVVGWVGSDGVMGWNMGTRPNGWKMNRMN